MPPGSADVNYQKLAMHLDMKTRCEKCAAALLASGEAYICSYECTFCPTCTSKMQGVCPNCGNELIRRPRRKASIVSERTSTVVSPGRSWLIWTVSFAVWAFVSIAAGISIYQFDRLRGMPVGLLFIVGLNFSQILTYAPLTPFVFALATRYPFQRQNWPRRLLLHFVGAMVFVVAHVILRGFTGPVWDSGTNRWVWAIWDSHAHAFHVRWNLFETLFFLNVVDDITGTYVPIVLIAHALSYHRRFRERELRASQLEGQLVKAHLQALKSQLQPHFLFNTMHSISALMLTDVHAADRMMTRLSDLLRMTLDSEGIQVTTLSREVEFVTGYLEIEKVRFEDRLNIVFDIAPDTLDAYVPHLLLQPLVENAVRHGVAKRSTPGNIRITATHDDRSLYLRVTDNGPGFAETSTRSGAGLGLRATRQRLQTIYGNEQSMEVREAKYGGVEVCVQIPFAINTGFSDETESQLLWHIQDHS